jgi:hypothetical protein
MEEKIEYPHINLLGRPVWADEKEETPADDEHLMFQAYTKNNQITMMCFRGSKKEFEAYIRKENSSHRILRLFKTHKGAEKWLEMKREQYEELLNLIWRRK